mgnify:CR=1 FL=1
MKKKFFKKVLSFALALSMVIPSTPIAVEAADSAVYEYEEVAVTEPVSTILLIASLQLHSELLPVQSGDCHEGGEI